jgi:hypothetical protein
VRGRGVSVGRVEINGGQMDQLWQYAERLYVAFVTYFGRLLWQTEPLSLSNSRS